MVPNQFSCSYACFDGFHRIASGPIPTVALAVKKARAKHAKGPVLIFHDASGQTIAIDTRGTNAEVLARLAVHVASDKDSNFSHSEGVGSVENSKSKSAEIRGRGRPKLGVVPREVTLLPRHWEWLGTQPGGASVALRKLVEIARKANVDKDRLRAAQERTCNFMTAIGGDLPGFEEATRALFANDKSKFRKSIAAWPKDVRDHAVWLAFSESEQTLTPANGLSH